jgi:hypothetical protein
MHVHVGEVKVEIGHRSRRWAVGIGAHRVLYSRLESGDANGLIMTNRPAPRSVAHRDDRQQLGWIPGNDRHGA